MYCYYCSHKISFEKPLRREATCSKCGQYLHCCRNCRFYDEKAYQKCRESQAEWVRDKTSANFCHYFEPSEVAPQSVHSKSNEAKKKLDQLFNKKADDDFIKSLIKKLKDNDVELRIKAAYSLGRIGTPLAIEPLLGLLKDENAEVRFVVVWALDEINPSRSMKHKKW